MEPDHLSGFPGEEVSSSDDTARLETSYRQLFEDSRDAVYISTTSGRLLDANEAMLTLTGYTRDELRRLDLVELYDDPADRERFRVEIAATGAVRNFAVTLRTKTGKPLRCLLTSTVRKDAAGAIVGYQGIIHDITELAKAQAALRRTNRALRVLGATLEASTTATSEQEFLDAVCQIVVDVGGYRLAWVGWPENTPDKRVRPVAQAGYEEGYLQHIVITYDDSPTGQGPVGTAIRTGRPAAAHNVSKDPAFRPWRDDALRRGYSSVAAIPLLEDGRAFGALTIYASEVEAFDDEELNLLERVGTELARGLAGRRARAESERLQARLQDAQKLEAVGRLAGGVAHEFNNLLTSIAGNVEFLREQVADDGESVASLWEIGRATKRAAELVHQLLAFSGKQVVARENVDVNALVKEMLPVVAVLAGEAITVETRLEAEPSVVRANRDQIRQVVLRLCDNARDAMPHGGTLRITTHNEVKGADSAADVADRQVVLAVTDTGEGMGDDTLHRASEPFFTTRDPFRRPGLGLSTVHGIVSRWSGVLELRSRPDEGTMASVSLPAHTAAAAGRPERVTPAPEARTVLVVEDEDAVRAVVCRTLDREGYTVMDAPNGEEALERAAAFDGEIDLLVTDVVMPGMAGSELSQVLEAQRPGLRVLYMSGHTEDEIVRRGIDRENVEFLQKPFSPRDLSTRVARLLASPRNTGPGTV
ncbi:MAG: GAF domain-containing protein [Gemmatimonadota bacterium]|jgi:two-component system, cell cycle sensor histidine kinase and response regulator CckA